MRLSEKTNNYLEEEKEKIEKSLKLFQWQILEENEEVMKYLDLVMNYLFFMLKNNF